MTARKKAKAAAVTSTAEADKPVEASITTFKGFNRDLTCRGFQFEIGKTYSVSGKVEACANGFHACEHPLNCFDYYPPATSRFFEVEQSGNLARHGSDTKVASATITLGVELSFGDMVQRAVKWAFDRATPENTDHATGYQGAASSTGDQGAASSTGDQGAASSTGDQGAASSTGYQGAASSTGYRGAASSTGYQGAASSTGDRGAASSTGDRGAASSTGDQGAASSTGDQGAASSTGKHAVACALGIEGRAMAGETGAIMLVNRDWRTGEIRHVFAAKVGERGIKPGVFYTLSDDGEPVEAA